MPVNKTRSCNRKNCHFKGFGRFLKIDSTCPINLWNRSFSFSKATDPHSLLRLMESNFDSILCTLSRGVLPELFSHLRGVIARNSQKSLTKMPRGNFQDSGLSHFLRRV
jgi:hypothetical protein